jgi:serine protease Do
MVMKRFTAASAACLGIPLLALAGLAGSLSGQTASKPAPAPPPQHSCPAAAPGQSSSFLDICPEQMEQQIRTFEQQMQSDLAHLQERLARIQEDAMSSPGLGKWEQLSAQLEGKAKEFASRAEELSARAEEFAEAAAQEAQEKTERIIAEAPEMFANPMEDGSGWLGIEIGEVTQEKAKDLKLSSVRGVIVTDVEPDSPAAKAGLKENDVITQFDGQTVEGTVQFRRLVRETPPGRTVALAISRDGAAQNLSVELGDRSAYFEKKMNGKMREYGTMQFPPMPPNFTGPDMPQPPDHAQGMRDWRTPVLGINAEDLTGQLGEFFGAPDNAGVLVREVRSGTPADKAGLKAGDVIVKVDDQPVRSVADLREQLRDKSDQKSVSLGILRKGEPMSLSVAIEKPRPLGPTPTVHRSES